MSLIAVMKLDDDDFTLLGLAPRFGIDRQDLDARWKALQVQVHPDRFAADGPAAQRQAMQWSVRVNEAYRRLRDPLSRAAYLCELRGSPVDAHRNTAMPADFLMQQMAWRESLEDAPTLSRWLSWTSRSLSRSGLCTMNWYNTSTRRPTCPRRWLRCAP